MDDGFIFSFFLMGAGGGGGLLGVDGRGHLHGFLIQRILGF